MDKSDRKPSILIISSNYPRYSGDVCGWFIHEISRQTACRGFNVTILSPHTEKSKESEFIDGILIRRFRYCLFSHFEILAYGSGMLYNLRKHPFSILTIPSFIIAELLYTCQIIHAKRPEIIHTHWLIPQGLIGALLHRFIKIPHIATIHGSDLNILKKYSLLYPIGRFITHNSSIITVNSNYMKQQLIAVSPDCEKEIHVIPMGINPDQFSVNLHTDMKKLHRSEYLILSVGRLIDWKGTIFLIKALPLVLEKYPNSKLIIAGTGPELEFLKNQASELGLQNRIEFLGLIPPSDLLSYYKSADVFVLPSINLKGKTEGLGVVLLEAMAAGCPVIGSAVGGIPDIIKNGENGFLVSEKDPIAIAEKIILLLSDTVLTDQFRKAGKETVQSRFSWDVISREFLDIYSNGIKK